MGKMKRSLVWVLALVLCIHVGATAAMAATDKTTKYRVYTYDRILQEFADYDKAVAYAKTYRYAHVEAIGSRKWSWDNFPRYQVYQNNVTMEKWQFATLNEAIAEARKWGNSSVRDLLSSGWVWDNFKRAAGYQLFQGEITMKEWVFTNLEAAKKEAKKWGNSHIIDLSNYTWIWDNMTEERKTQFRSGSPVYQVYIDDETLPEWSYAFLQDAIVFASEQGNAKIVNTAKSNKVVYENQKPFVVKQNGKPLHRFAKLDDAIAYAKKWGHSTVSLNDREIWNNYPYYQVYQSDRLIGEHKTMTDALAYAVKYANASIRTYDGYRLWDNIRKLQFVAWNGESRPNSVMEQVSITQGLDVDSPTWFILSDASGAIKDTSDKELAKWLKDRGIAVYPLVHNQFDSKLTTRFLADAKAKSRFIDELVKRCAELGVDGINIDFESLAGSDRAAFTKFMSDLTKAFHAKNMKVSIDLPRGDDSWNHLTAFDHAALAQIVDTIMIMAYDHHWSGSPNPGPVAGLKWAEDGVKQFLSYGVPRDKLLLGVPLYTREWTLDKNGKMLGNRAVTLRQVPEILATKSVTKTWDDKFGQYKIEYADGDNKRVFWLEDDDVLKARLAIAKKYDLAGIAAWRLGHDHADVWSLLIQGK